MAETFSLERFEQQMAEMMMLLERESAILDEMLRDLGVDPSPLQECGRDDRSQQRGRGERRARRRGGAPARTEDDEMVMTRVVSEEARRVLERCVVGDDIIQLPRADDGSRKTLDRKLYEELNGVLEALGGTWNRRREAHVFADATDLADRFYGVVETGTFERPQDSGFYPTPDWLVEKMVAAAAIAVNHRVLEPSAGRGAILTRIKKIVFNTAQIVACELLPDNRKELKKHGFDCDAEDFLTLDLGPVFDRVLMNPPFARSQAPIHVRHAIRQLKPGGRLVGIMPSSIIQRQDRLHREVRAEIMRSGKIMPLPDDTFAQAGTSVRTVLVVYDKPTNREPFPTAQEPHSAPQKPQEPSNGHEVTTTPPRRFQRLSDKPRRFRRLRRLKRGTTS